MKTKLFLYLTLILILLGCSFFSSLSPASSENQPDEDDPSQDASPISTEGWLLPDPTVGLAGLESYHQELTISFQGTLEGAPYEWMNTHQHDIWKEASADFWTLKTTETGMAATETLLGTVDQAHYSRTKSGEPCQVWWGETAEGSGGSRQPAELLLPIDKAKETGTETVNDVPTRHYMVSAEEAGTKTTGDLWLAESGGYVIRYVLTLSDDENEQRFEYNLSQVNSTRMVAYPEGCVAVLTDFPVMDEALNIQRLPTSVSYTIPAVPAAISQFYQDQLASQGWTFVAAHDKDPKNVVLVFTNADKGQAASILLDVRDESVWVSAILRPWEPASSAP